VSCFIPDRDEDAGFLSFSFSLSFSAPEEAPASARNFLMCAEGVLVLPSEAPAEVDADVDAALVEEPPFSMIPAGVTSRAPSVLNASRRKKGVDSSSPYMRCERGAPAADCLELEEVDALVVDEEGSVMRECLLTSLTAMSSGFEVVSTE
jgi:hypothetical protein